ncbi:hypothetical protein [Pleionea sp. CnH1-48]|uniref:hypothetical protein n=1 Tax=Pleionea sp. CnH1-48 TaxID=2954494 RepID=UPI00209745EB|nr:hypothetical protein [Pleionea sp. CnH1-48]MCO7223426.1 hypothetical protein [Pleionea sp. CnH1-48]
MLNKLVLLIIMTIFTMPSDGMTHREREVYFYSNETLTQLVGYLIVTCYSTYSHGKRTPHQEFYGGEMCSPNAIDEDDADGEVVGSFCSQQIFDINADGIVSSAESLECVRKVL